MTNDELATQLADLPGRLLRRLAKGRVSRHAGMGKNRLIHMLLSLPPDQRARVEVALQSLQHELPPLQPDTAPSPPVEGAHRQKHTPRRTGHHDRQPVVEGSHRQKPSRAPGSHPPRPAADAPPATTIDALLQDIGVPPPQPFTPDPWQQEAVDLLATGNVILSVPTGSGKTYVAVEAMRRAIAAEQTVIYTSPLKALSNTKLTEFVQIFGAENVGILTGDRRDNPQATILIMTTEILRNLLYDAGGGEIDMRLNTLGLVILDESQFIADPERGVVWEETIIFCPAQTRMLLLSASIGNPDEVATWISSIRSTPCHLVHHRNRSVPLRAAYLDPSGKLAPLFHTRDIVRDHTPPLHPDTKYLFTRYEDQTLGPRSRREN
ncbi:MAG: DEAD/DEAH box helicase [Nitrospira sp.]|nr:DEAD/DEAH box helicase [Nitrospira sp.]MDD9859784.1 DEAD/DEAH box helicase [Nitrospira sp.]